MLNQTIENNVCFPRFFLLFLGATFLLFPIAHLRFFDFLPLYISEGMLLLAVAVLIGQRGFSAVTHSFFRSICDEKPLFFAIILFLAGITISLFINPHEISALSRFKSFYLAPILLATLIMFTVREEKTLRFIAGSWFLGAAIAAIAALLAAREGIFLYDGRLSGMYQSANYLALLVAPGPMLGLYLFFATKSQQMRVGLFFLSFLSLWALYLTRSYAAWTSLTVVFLVIGTIFLWKKNFFRQILLLFLIVFSTMFALIAFERENEKFQQLITFDDRSSLASRLMIWRTGKDIALDRWVLGIGTGRFQEFYLERQREYPPYLEWAVPTPHNLYLHFLIEGGIFAITGFFLILLLGLSRFLVKWKEVSPENESGLKPFLLGTALALFYLLYGIIDTPYMKNDLVLAVWSAISIFFAVSRSSLQSRE